MSLRSRARLRPTPAEISRWPRATTQRPMRPTRPRPSMCSMARSTASATRSPTSRSRPRRVARASSAISSWVKIRTTRLPYPISRWRGSKVWTQHVTGSDVKAPNGVGGLAGCSQGATISHVRVTGQVTGGDGAIAGGIIGWQSGRGAYGRGPDRRLRRSMWWYPRAVRRSRAESSATISMAIFCAVLPRDGFRKAQAVTPAALSASRIKPPATSRAAGPPRALSAISRAA